VFRAVKTPRHSGATTAPLRGSDLRRVAPIADFAAGADWEKGEGVVGVCGEFSASARRMDRFSIHMDGEVIHVDGKSIHRGEKTIHMTQELIGVT
jgi:hypothetical protein